METCSHSDSPISFEYSLSLIARFSAFKFCGARLTPLLSVRRQVLWQHYPPTEGRSSVWRLLPSFSTNRRITRSVSPYKNRKACH